METNPKKIIADYEVLKSQATRMQSSWDELHKIYLAQGDEILEKSEEDGKVNRKYEYSDTPYQAVQVLTAGLHSYLTGPTNNWFALRAKDKNLQNSTAVTSFLEELEDLLRASISNTNFDTEQDDFYASSVVYGSAVMYIEEDADDDLRFNTIPIKDIFWQENARGKIDIWDIRHMYTANQAVSRFGIDNVSGEVKRAYENSQADDTKYEYLLHVEPRHVRDDTKIDSLNMPISTTWIEVDRKLVVQEGGLLENPFAYHRFYKIKASPYGRSPCMMTLKSSKMLNKTLQISFRALSMAIDGPIDVPINSYVGKIDLNPGKLLYRRGEEKMSPIRTNANIQPADYLINLYKEDIKEGLFNKAIISLGDITKRMAGLEVSELIAEKMVLLGPAVGRYLDEFAGNVIQRSIAILARRGKLPEPPEELGEDFEYKIEFISPLAKAQRSNELQSINTVLSIAGNMANVVPEVIDNIDPDVTIREVGDVTGATVRMFRSEKQVKQIREARVAAQEKAELAEQAQQGIEIQKGLEEVTNGN